MNLFKSLTRLLNDNSVSKIELTATPPFVKLVFDREELVALLKGQAQISEVVSKQFVRRRVFWEDLAKEYYEYVIESLAQAEIGIDSASNQIADSKDPAAQALTKFLRGWAAACGTTLKTLKQRLDDIQSEKDNILGYDTAGEDRRTAVRDSVTLLRRTVYPFVTALISFLPGDDPTKTEAQRLLDQGFSQIGNAQVVRESQPEWDEATSK